MCKDAQVLLTVCVYTYVNTVYRIPYDSMCKGTPMYVSVCIFIVYVMMCVYIVYAMVCVYIVYETIDIYILYDMM